MADGLTSHDGALWLQPDGPNGEMQYVGCVDLDAITIPEGDIDLSRCFSPSGTGWDIITEKVSPPGNVTSSITGIMQRTAAWLEKVRCPFSLYAMQRDCERPDVFSNYVRGIILANVRRTGQTYTDIVRREEDADSTYGLDVEAWCAHKIFELEIDRQTAAATDNLNDIAMNDNERCIGDCGETLDKCEQGIVVGDSAIAPALASAEVTADGGVIWTPIATDPFAAGEGIMSAVRFVVGRDTIRLLVAMEAPVGGQGMVGYSDDDGATWTLVNIGGAVAGEGAVYGGALFALDARHIWLAGANGSIYFSSDGAETWVQQEAGVVTGGSYNYVHFADEKHGVAGAPADIIAITSDGGVTWAAATATGSGDAILCCVRLDVNRIWIGTDTGGLWFSTDGGTTWTQRTGWPGSGVGDVRDLAFVNDHVAFMLSDTAAPVGTILRTINGGRDWEPITTPANSGLNAIHACDENTAFAVGEINAATGVILYVHAA